MAKVVLLAAGRGKRFGKRTKRLPKCLIPLDSKGKNLLSRYLDAFRELKLLDITVVVGHEKEQIVSECVEKGRGLSIRFLENREYQRGSIVSLFTASGEMTDDCLVMDADVFFEANSLKKILKARKTSFLLDPRSRFTGEEMMVMAKNKRPVRVAKTIDPDLKILGEAVGFLFVKKKDAKSLAHILKQMISAGKKDVEYEESYNELMKQKVFSYEKISGFWTEMDFEEDLEKIRVRMSCG